MTPRTRSRPQRHDPPGPAGPTGHPDPEVLGAQGLAARRDKRYPEALDAYRRAEAAAGDALGVARWVSKQGGVLRLMERAGPARDAFERARQLFLAAGEAGLAGLADQEGNLGLLAADDDDDLEAEFAYRRAIELAGVAGDQSGVALWSVNLGQALTRRRLYRRAWEAFQAGLAAARQAGDPDKVMRAVEAWAESASAAERPGDAARVLVEGAGAPLPDASRARLLAASLPHLARAGAFGRVREVGRTALDLLREIGASPAAIAAAQDAIRVATEREAPAGAPPATRVPALDVVIPRTMARAQEVGSPGLMGWVAHLVADIHWALGASAEAGWRTHLSEPGLRSRAVGDAMLALCAAGRVEESLEISQRLKGAAFALPSLGPAARSPTAGDEVRGYLAALEALRAVALQLEAGAGPDVDLRAMRVRAAGEAFLEAGEHLRGRDRSMHARLGGAVLPSHLIDAFPAGDPIAIVDLVTTPDGILAHVLTRHGSRVRTRAIHAKDLTVERVAWMARAWTPSMIHAADPERQRSALQQVSRELHDGLFCRLAHWLAEERVGQVVLVPDAFLRHLPLHLAGVCAKDISIPGVAVAAAEYFCEAFPVEYAPCLQAVAVSQHQRRPQTLRRIASFSDAQEDLPGARHSGRWLATRIGAGIDYLDRSGPEVTRVAVEEEVRRADVLLLATHGHFDASRPAASFLRLRDHDWTAEEIASLAPLGHSPAAILAACEVSAASPGDDPDAAGVPGALLAAGAAFVLGSRWPVEDVSMGLLIERFVHHLAHLGYRPAAALFRAVRDLRRMPRAEVVAYARTVLGQMERDGSRERAPEAYLALDWRAIQLEAGGHDQPFADPWYWGGVTVSGSGWAGLAGGVAMAMPSGAVQSVLDLDRARSLLAEGQAAEARQVLTATLQRADGIQRVPLLELLAQTVAVGGHPRCRAATLAEVRALLDEAAFVARAEQRPQLERNVEATRQKLELLYEA